MHGQVRDHLEEVLAGPHRLIAGGAADHLAKCRECRDEVSAMRHQAALLRTWRVPPEEIDPRPGFYARVMERIEAEGPASIWSLFFDSALGKRLAFASLALAALLCVVLISSERFSADSQVAEQTAPFSEDLQGQVMLGEDQPGVVLTGAPDQDSVLVNLVTYRAQ